MSNKGEKTPHVVIAAAKDEACFEAVQVRRQDRTIEVLWAKSLPAGEGSWTALAGVCGLTSGREGHDKAPRRHAAAVVGLDSTAVAFYRVTAPAVEPQEMASIVRMQAEALLPLPPDQIEVAWRATPATNGNVEITIAAARREYLHKFSGSAHDFRPDAILLSCEGMAKAWHRLFSAREPRALLVSIGRENTQVCLVQDGLVTQAALLAMGRSDLEEEGPRQADYELEKTLVVSPATEARGWPSVERFAQDMHTVRGSFGWEESASWPLFVLSDGSEALSRIVDALNAAGLPVQVSVPEPRNLKMPAGFGPREIYDYRTPLGLALLALEKPSGALNLFERLAEQEEQKKATSAWRSVVLAGAVAAAVLIALIVTVYLTDTAAAKRWTELAGRPDFEAARQHQAMLKTVARHRPDLLELLATINAGKNDGIVLDSLHFRKGQTVAIAGQAGNTEQMWAFEKNLRAQKDVIDPQIENPAQDSKTKKIKFTIRFGYKTFSRKDAVL
ncbi:MAG: hypothetical protein FJ280_14775 [Planctomycetes bacterium]|nr:hypothetical protein [Planctomycetota bacterium]